MDIYRSKRLVYKEGSTGRVAETELFRQKACKKNKEVNQKQKESLSRYSLVHDAFKSMFIQKKLCN